MADFNELKAIIEEAIRENGREEITGDILQGVLLSIVDKLGDEEINTLYQLVSDEVEARQGADNTLQGNIDAEELRAKGAERANAQAIADEEIRAKAAEKVNADDIDIIEGKIPAQASAQNQLADKRYVDDKVATDTATFRGSYNQVSDLGLSIDATHAEVGAALAEAMAALVPPIVPDNNDYCYVQVPDADETPTEIERVDRYKFNSTDWVFEYSIISSGFTAAQWAALNSGITSGHVEKLNLLPTNAQLQLVLNSKATKAEIANTPDFVEEELSEDIENEIDRVLTALYQALEDAGVKISAAQQAAALAQAKATLANDAALAADAAAEAANGASETALRAAGVAMEKGGYAEEKGDEARDAATLAGNRGAYAKDQGDYAKEQGDYAKNKGDYAKEKGDYAKAKADEIEDAKGEFQTLDARLDAMEEAAGDVTFVEAGENEWGF